MHQSNSIKAFGVPFYRRIPILRSFIYFSFGIMGGFYTKTAVIFPIVGIVCCIVALVIYQLLSLKRQYLLQWLQGLFVWLLCFFIGACYIQLYQKDKQPNFPQFSANEKTTSFISLNEPLQEKAKTYKATATIHNYQQIENKQWQKTNAQLIVYFKKDSSFKNFKAGDTVLLSSVIQPITNAGNPGGFDYKGYCARQGIYFQTFVKANELIHIKRNNKQFHFQFWLYDVRNKMLAILDKHIKDKNALAVAEALLVGYRLDLDRDLVQAYSNTGVIHIIAISGLHLGILYSLLSWLLFFLPKNRWFQIGKGLFIIAVLWLFTLLAGAAPSILRSAIMFSCLIVGNLLDKKSDIFNNLAVSAFGIVYLNPFSLWDVGFQLSYLAVLSILLFYQRIKNLLFFKNKITTFIWSLNAVTIAAQILTLPVIIYHFHQIPLLFLVANLVAVPLALVLLPLTILLILIEKITALAAFIGWLTEYLIVFMNNYIVKVNAIPNSVINGIQINMTEVLLIYLCIFFIMYWLITKYFIYLKAFLIVVIFLFSIKAFRNFQQQQQKLLIVYNVPQKTGIDVINGQDYRFLGDTTLLSNGFLRNFHLQPSRTLYGIAWNEKLLATAIKAPWIISYNKRILVVSNKLKPTAFLKQKMQVDAVIFCQNTQSSVKELAGFIDSKHWIFDSSNSFWKINQWKKECNELHLRHYSTREQGAFILPL
ncbi:MAG: ComEC/Rec2 family competence protein [Chitinophagaceae bacterium]